MNRDQILRPLGDLQPRRGRQVISECRSHVVRRGRRCRSLWAPGGLGAL